MKNDPRKDTNQDPANVWQGQPVENVRLSLEDIRSKSRKLQKTVKRRNLREYAAGLIVVAGFAYYITAFASALIRAGCGLTIAGTLFVMYALHRRGAARAAPSEAGRSTCVDFHRKELQRQRDLLRGIWSWYLLPFVPGVLVSLFGFFVLAMEQPTAPARAPLIILTFAVTILGVAALFLVVAMLNRRAARRLQRDIDALDGAEEET
jgi:hypothetical protein